MTWRLLTATMMALLAAVVPLGFARSQVPTQSSRWVADWGERRCAIIRSASGDQPLTLSIRLIPGDRSPELLLVDPAWTADPFIGERNVTIILLPSGERVSLSGLIVRLQANGPRMLQAAGLGENFLDHFAQSATLKVQYGERQLAEIPIPQAAAAAAALRACNDALLRNWGVDPVAMAALQRLPKAVLIHGRIGWLDDGDYPSSAIRARESGTVTYRFTVELDGRVTDCTPVVSSGSALLDRTACRILLERGRYEPAVGLDGHAVRTTTVDNFNWVLPGELPTGY